jgi:hypothetical protein
MELGSLTIFLANKELAQFSVFSNKQETETMVLGP